LIDGVSRKRDSFARRAFGIFVRRRTAVLGLVVLTIVISIAVLAPWISPYSPTDQDLLNRLNPPNNAHWFGTDLYGRDVLSRIVWGARVSLIVGVLSILVAASAGTFIALLLSFASPVADSIVMRLVDIMMVFPPLVLAIALVAIIGPGLLNIIIAVAIASTPQFARVVRSEILTIREYDYIEAARAIGASNTRILTNHIMRSIWSPVIVIASLQVANAILLEATLSFFGLGVSTPTASWGYMISTGRSYLMIAPWLSLIPGVFILMTVLSLNLLGDGLRDALDPRLG